MRLRVRELRRAGVDADLVYEGIARAKYAQFFGAPGSDQHYRELGGFLAGCLRQS